jgi:hypothetical protein
MSFSQSSPTSETRTIRQNDRRFQLPNEGIVYPSQIVLPPPNASRPEIIGFGQSLGIYTPHSYNRVRLLERIVEILVELGYEIENENIYTRDEPIRLISEGRRVPAPDISLPEVISSSVFATRDSLLNFIRGHNLVGKLGGSSRLKRDLARKLKEFLVEQGYQGNFYLSGGTTIQGGYELPGLITVDQYYETIVSSEPIQVIQDDLFKLNLPLNQLVSTLSKRMWPTLDDFAVEVGQHLEIAPEVMKVVALLAHLPRESNQTLTKLLYRLGNTQPFRNVQEKRETIQSYFRTNLSLIPREYSRREDFKGNATTTMTFLEAIKGGYLFGTEQYEEEIDDLVGNNHLSQKQNRYLVELIQMYPDMIDVMTDYYTNGTTLTHRLINLYYTDTPSILQEIYAFAVNYPLIFPETEEERKRRIQLRELPRTYLRTLYQIYRTREFETILEMDQDPLELYVIAVSKVNTKQLRNLVIGFGMIIPEHLINNEVRPYVLNWMIEYQAILTRSNELPAISEILTEQPQSVRELFEILRPYTDQEIITFFGYISGFENRNALIENIYDLITEEGFIVLKEIDFQRATNVETVMLTELPDLLKPYIVFGSPLSYRVHEIDEFIQAWSGGSNDNAINFRKIVDNGNYSIAQVSKLQSLLPLMASMNGQLKGSVDQLLTIVKSGIIRTLRRSREVDRLIREIRSAPEYVQENLKDIIWKLFYIGMYMRRWRGPGNSYPTRSSMTRVGNNPEPKVILELGKLSEMLASVQAENPEIYDYLIDLPEIVYNTGGDNISIRQQKIFNTVDKVADGKYCIRQASDQFVLAGHYYLGVIFGEIIPDFSPYDVEAIS